MEEKFKADPYNPNNKLISESDILNIMKSLDIQDFKINNLSLYQRAFAHKSYCPMKDYEEFTKPDNCLALQDTSYETLEFLGDAFLGSIIANYLYRRYVHIHNQDEGFLTKLKIRFVCGEQLAYLSGALHLNQYMIISKHIEENCDGRNNMIDGFDSRTIGMYEGQTLAVRIPAKDAYGENPDNHDLGGEDLIFIIEVASII